MTTAGGGTPAGGSPSTARRAGCASPGGRLRVLCVLNGGIEHPSSRLRVLPHPELLKGRGIDADVFLAKRRRAADLAHPARRARRSHAVPVPKKQFPALELPPLLRP